MPVRINDLRLLEDFEHYLTEKLIEAQVDTLVLEQLRGRLMALQLEFVKLITEDPPDDSPQNITINNFISGGARNANK